MEKENLRKSERIPFALSTGVSFVRGKANALLLQLPLLG